MHTPAELAALHFDSYGAPATLYAAPGRVNLIGEHTDYCDGFVMPAAIDFSTVVAISQRNDGRLLVHSVNYEDHVDHALNEFLDDRFAQLRGGSETRWSDYVAGVLWKLREHGVPVADGFSITIEGDVPLGAGLSSSAAIEVATAFAVLGAASFDMPLEKIAQLCRAAESGFVGANVGIMDQFVSCCGAQDHAVMIDCRSLQYTLAPIPSDVRIVICNSMVKHSVAGGEYNTRRAEIEEGTGILRRHRPEIKALRDATVEDLRRWGNEMPDNVLRRCRHVVTEDNRVLAAVDAFRAGDLPRFGQLMREAHISFRDDFEASCKEIDILVELANERPECFGARLTGGGFGGCTVNLVSADRVDEFTRAMRDGYKQATGIDSDIYVSRASAGAHQILIAQ
ncbi:MAG TPA: galactokinase [Acidobacteriaceae bacterium]|jgi:galactokinase|nr:galactokinase [Acidobacteriaceae bacterium]